VTFRGELAPEEDVDDGVWSAGPLWNNFGHRAAVLGMVFPRGRGSPFFAGHSERTWLDSVGLGEGVSTR